MSALYIDQWIMHPITWTCSLLCPIPWQIPHLFCFIGRDPDADTFREPLGWQCKGVVVNGNDDGGGQKQRTRSIILDPYESKKAQVICSQRVLMVRIFWACTRSTIQSNNFMDRRAWGMRNDPSESISSASSCCRSISAVHKPHSSGPMV